MSKDAYDVTARCIKAENKCKALSKRVAVLSKRVVELEKKNEEFENVLRWLDGLGGLGFVKHNEIKKVLGDKPFL